MASGGRLFFFPKLGRNGSRRRDDLVRGRRDDPAAVAPDKEPAVDTLLGRHGESGDLSFIKDEDVGHIPVFPGLHADDLFCESAVFRHDRRFSPLERPLVEIDEILDESFQREGRRGRPARPQDDDGLLQEAGPDLVPVGGLAAGGTDETVDPGDEITGRQRRRFDRRVLRLT